MNPENELIQIDGTLNILHRPTGLPIYDFDFRAFFPCRTSIQGGSEAMRVVARIGAFENYEEAYSNSLEQGRRLLHTPEEYYRCSQLSGWFRLIEEFTPKSRWYEVIPTATCVQEEFGWPVFVKGLRQTSRHQRSLSIITSPDEYQRAVSQYATDPILRWQPIVVREFIPLQRVEDADPNRIPSSFEFRTFWWRGTCVGAGRYWWEGRRYDWNDEQRRQAIAIAEQAAKRINVPFLVIDMALTEEGRWIVIECNDAQESGYAAVSPLGMWSNIIEIERGSERG